MQARIVVAAVGVSVVLAVAGIRARAAQKPSGESAAAAAPSQQAMGQAPARALLDQYCVTCHSQRMKAGSLVLDSASLDLSHIGQDGVVWEKVVRKLRGRLMPPAGQRRPDDATYEAFTGWVEAELDKFAADHPDPGRTETFRRLNRAEYQNAVRDLLALDVDASQYVPSDDTAFGFDNIGGVFKLSSTLMESYLSAADKISRLALGVLPSTVDEGQRYSARRLQQHARIEGLPFGTRGGMLVQHLFPQDGDYSFKIEVADDFSGEPYAMDLMIDGAVAHAFTVRSVQTYRQSFINGNNKQELANVARVAVTAGPHEVGVAFRSKPPAIPEYVNKPFQVPGPIINGGNAGPGGPAPAVQGMTIGGPYQPAGPGDTPSRRRILTCTPTTATQESACAKAILSALARRAFRRPDPDVAPLLAFYGEARADGASFETGIQKALWRLLASPEFLFHIEAAPQANLGQGLSAYRLGDIELASRLSFLIWSSIPDDRLLELAGQGRLKDSAVLAREVERMLSDPRSQALTANFAGQWLQLRKLDSARPGGDYAKNFDESLRQGLRRETELFFNNLVRENRPVPELLTADYTFLNERVAQHYGLSNVQGSHFRRVTWPADSPRRGLLGQGSVLTLTSQGIRTSPVGRGKYILERIMGTPPPDPPPDVPSLPEGKEGAKPQTMRERMAAHRANPVCSSCHSMIDPLGFSLENFDPVGRWRDLDEGLLKVDASGALPDGRAFGNVNQLRALLTQRPELLTKTLTENLLIYALGRGLEHYDMPVVRKIVRDAGRSDYRFHSIVLGIVTSDPFQMRRATTAPVVAVASR